MARMKLDIDANDKGSAKVQAFQAVVKRTSQHTQSAASAMKNMSNSGIASMKSLSSSVSGVVSTLKGLAVAVGTSMIAQKAIEVSDAYQQLSSRVSLVTKSEAERQSVLSQLYATSQNTRSDMTATGQMYTRLAQSADTLGISQSNIIQFTGNLNKLIAVSGANAEEASAGLLQLSQGMASNRLGGDELRSVMEQLPAVAKTIADSLGVGIGKFREMSQQGKITASVVMDAILNSTGKIDSAFEKMPVTFGQSFTKIKNAAFMAFGEVASSSGFTKLPAEASSPITDIIDNNKDSFKIIGENLRPALEAIKPIIQTIGYGFMYMVEGLSLIVKCVDELSKTSLGPIISPIFYLGDGIKGAFENIAHYAKYGQAIFANMISNIWTDMQIWLEKVKAFVPEAFYSALAQVTGAFDTLAQKMAKTFGSDIYAKNGTMGASLKTYYENEAATRRAAGEATIANLKHMNELTIQAAYDAVDGVSNANAKIKSNTRITMASVVSDVALVVSAFSSLTTGQIRISSVEDALNRLGSAAETAAGKIKQFYGSMLSFSVDSIQTGLDGIKGKLEDAQAFAQSQGEMNEKLKKLTGDATINGQTYSPLSNLSATQQEYAAKSKVLELQKQQVQQEYMLEQAKAASTGKDVDKSKLNDLESKRRTLQSQIDNLPVMEGLDTKVLQQEDALKGMNAQLAQTEASLAQINAQSQAMSQLNDLRKELTAPVTVGENTYAPMSAIEASKQEFELKTRTLALQNEQLSQQMTIAQSKQGAERDEAEINKLLGEQNALRTESTYLGKVQQLSELVQKQKKLNELTDAQQQSAVSSLQAQQSLSDKMYSARIAVMPTKTYDDVLAKGQAELTQLREKLDLEEQSLKLNYQITQSKIEQENNKGEAKNAATLQTLTADLENKKKEINNLDKYRTLTLQKQEIDNQNALNEKADALTKYMKTLNEGMEDFSRAMSTVAAGVAESLVSGFGTFMTDLVNKTKTAKEALIDFAQSVSNSFVKSISEMVAKKALSSLASAVGFPGLGDAAGSAATTANTTATTANTAAVTSMTAALTSSSALGSATNAVTGTATSTNSGGMFSGIWDSIKSGVSSTGSWISSSFSSMTSGLGSMLSGAWSGISSLLGSMGSGIASLAGGAGSMLSGGMSALMSILPMLMLAKGGVMSEGMPVSAFANGGIFGDSIMKYSLVGMLGNWLFANGGAFSGGHQMAFANGGAFTNSIVSSPTLFKMANGGTGLMGEAGPEAVMPLTRTAGGKLGVRANLQVQGVGGGRNSGSGQAESSAAAHETAAIIAKQIGAYFQSRDGKKMLGGGMEGNN